MKKLLFVMAVLVGSSSFAIEGHRDGADKVEHHGVLPCERRGTC